MTPPSSPRAGEAVGGVRLRSALERTLHNFEALLASRPVRDAAETIAEARAALASPEPDEEARHHPNDNCGDPNHDAILEAWYRRAEGLLDRLTGADEEAR